MPDLPKSVKVNLGKKITKPRKYATGHSTWRAIRLQHLYREPLCRHCKAKGLTVAGKAVDHINNDSWDNTPANLQTLCTACHTIKTNREDGSGFKRSS